MTKRKFVCSMHYTSVYLRKYFNFLNNIIERRSILKKTLILFTLISSLVFAYNKNTINSSYKTKSYNNNSSSYVVPKSPTVKVGSYYKDNGTYVESHYRTAPNKTTLDNWSTKGNINPYTGKSGTKANSYSY